MIEVADVRPISDLRLRQQEVLDKLSEGPVVLSQRGRATAVLVSWEKWNRLSEQLELLQDTAEAAAVRERIAAGATDVVSLADYVAQRDEEARVPA